MHIIAIKLGMNKGRERGREDGRKGEREGAREDERAALHLCRINGNMHLPLTGDRSLLKSRIFAHRGQM